MSALVEDVKDQYGHPRIPYRGHYDRKHCDERRTWIETFCNCNLTHVGEWWNNEGENPSCSCEKLQGNIENPIGLAKIPIGIAGPLLVKGDHINGYALCPFATTEGALVASATRGAAALTRAGGVTCKVFSKAMSRAPVFVTHSIHDSDKLDKWIKANTNQLQDQIAEYSQHTKLIKTISFNLGTILIVSFIFDCDDAAGQNMVTSASTLCSEWLLRNSEKKVGVKIIRYYCYSLASGEKSMSFINMLIPRGVHVVAEAWLPESIIKTTLKTNSEDLFRLYRYCVHGAISIGRIGVSLNAANTIASVFTATGQDIAALSEATASHFVIEPATHEDIKIHCTPGSFKPGETGLYLSMALPNLIIGTIGGGTGLATQKECLQMMGCYGKDGMSRLAEIIVGFCMSLDLSTLSAGANGTFALSHEKLGKNRPENGLKTNMLNKKFFQHVVGDKGTVIDWKLFDIDTLNSILSNFALGKIVKLIGHFGYIISYNDNHTGTTKSIKVVIKSKPTSIELCNVVNKIAQDCGSIVASTYERNKSSTGLRHSSEREIYVMSLNDSAIKRILPEVYYTINDTGKDIHVIVMDYIDTDKGYTLLNTVDDITVWKDNDIKVVLRDLAQFHASFSSKELSHILKNKWIEEMSTDTMVNMAPLWEGLLDHAVIEFPELWTNERVSILDQVIQRFSDYWLPMKNATRTLAHNDCNPRNISIRIPNTFPSVDPPLTNTIPYYDPRTLCLYDWELCRIDVPQHDVAEFLAFVLPPNISMAKRMEFIEFYRVHLEYYSEMEYPIERFMSVYNVACLDFAINRLLLYTMVNTAKSYQFLPRVISTHMNYLEQIFYDIVLQPQSTKSKL